jgi:hypothetical protein
MWSQTASEQHGYFNDTRLRFHFEGPVFATHPTDRRMGGRADRRMDLCSMYMQYVFLYLASCRYYVSI